MRNRNLITRKLDTLGHTLRNLERIVNTKEPVSIYKEQLNKANNLLDEVKDYIEAEPLSPNEINKR